MMSVNIELEQLKQEEEYLKKTLAVIKELIENDDNSIKDKMAEIQEMKKYDSSKVFYDVIDKTTQKACELGK